jgi:hypothetical protein
MTYYIRVRKANMDPRLGFAVLSGAHSVKQITREIASLERALLGR